MKQPDIAAALEAFPAVRARFDALPPSHRAEYLKWIDEAKRDTARSRPIKAMVERLAAA